MDSTPPAIITSEQPLAIWLAANAMEYIVSAVNRMPPEVNQSKTIGTFLAEHEKCRDILTMLHKLEGASLKFNVANLVTVILATAILHTGFADAGARFRDRVSRQEAARHLGDSVNALILTRLSPS